MHWLILFISGMAEVEMVKHLGYTPNYYDYRSERISCDACYRYRIPRKRMGSSLSRSGTHHKDVRELE